MKNKFTSSVLHNGHIYGLDESILASVNAETGEQNWKGGRYGYGQLVLAGNHLVVLTEDGDVVLVNATPARHEEIARFPAIADLIRRASPWRGTLLFANAVTARSDLTPPRCRSKMQWAAVRIHSGSTTAPPRRSSSRRTSCRCGCCLRSASPGLC